MIKIRSTTSRNLDSIADSYYASAERSILLRIGRLKAPQWMKNFFVDNLYMVITGKPSELNILNNYFKRTCEQKGYKEELAKAKAENVFNYAWLSDSKARTYDLAEKLKVNTCPYCNRNYTVTVRKGKKALIVRPDFDHYFPQSEYPLLALSFYNLIPSCLLCNRSIKLAKNMNYGKFIHPYEDEFGKDLKFNFHTKDTVSMRGLGTKFEIKVIHSKKRGEMIRKCSNSFKLFKLKAIYEASHLSEIADIIRKHHVSSGRYLGILHKQFNQLGTIEELYRIAFGNLYNEDDFANRPLSKMTKDIVEQLSFTIPKIK